MAFYFLNYFLLILAASIITNGFFMITRGNYEIQPDGSRAKKGALLKGYYFFFFREWPTAKRHWYSGDELSELFDMIRANVPGNITMILNRAVQTANNSSFPKDMKVGGSFQVDGEFINYFPKLRKSLGVKFKTERIPHSENMNILVYKEEPNYVFNYYIRTMLAGCITCFSSFYGMLIFILANLIFSDEVLEYSLYGFYGNVPAVVYYPLTALCYCVSLAYVNTLLWKKVN